MKRTTVMLPVSLKVKAERQAGREGISLGQFIRQSMEKQLASTNRNGKKKRSPLFADHFTFNDKYPPDVSADLDKYLDEIQEEEMKRWREV